MTIRIKRQCSTCQAWHPNNPDDYPFNGGECRRLAPTHEGFPPVNKEWWCLQYAPDLDQGELPCTPQN